MSSSGFQRLALSCNRQIPKPFVIGGMINTGISGAALGKASSKPFGIAPEFAPRNPPGPLSVTGWVFESFFER
jgi:hypothetical protein